MQLELMKEFCFEASHILPKHPGKCSRLHGHSWKLRVYVKGEINPETGFVMDYADIKAAVQPIVDALDHKHLGTWILRESKSGEVNFFAPEWQVGPDYYLPFEFYPSSEKLIVWIGKELLFCHALRKRSLQWHKLELDETCTSRCILTREEYEKQARRGSESI